MCNCPTSTFTGCYWQCFPVYPPVIAECVSPSFCLPQCLTAKIANPRPQASCNPFLRSILREGRREEGKEEKAEREHIDKRRGIEKIGGRRNA